MDLEKNSSQICFTDSVEKRSILIKGIQVYAGCEANREKIKIKNERVSGIKVQRSKHHLIAVWKTLRARNVTSSFISTL